MWTSYENHLRGGRVVTRTSEGGVLKPPPDPTCGILALAEEPFGGVANFSCPLSDTSRRCPPASIAHQGIFPDERVRDELLAALRGIFSGHGLRADISEFGPEAPVSVECSHLHPHAFNIENALP